MSKPISDHVNHIEIVDEFRRFLADLPMDGVELESMSSIPYTALGQLCERAKFRIKASGLYFEFAMETRIPKSYELLTTGDSK